MNSGFGSTHYLKSLILPPQLRERTEWDDALAALGRGVVAQFQNVCNRTFARMASAIYIRDAACLTVSLSRYPLESVTSISLRLATESLFTLQDSSVIANTDLDAGLIHLAQPLGGTRDQIKIIYTGGYWWNVSEDESDTQPDNSNTVPDDLISAWSQQVQHLVEVTQLLKAQSAQSGKDAPKTEGLKLLPGVTDILQRHIRMS